MITNNGVELLRVAVVKQAVNDYKCALRFHDTREIVKLERFFLDDLSIWCNLDGKYIVDNVRKQVNNHSGRETI